MRLLLFLFEICLSSFFSWTLAYHFCLLARLPARLVVVPFLVLFAPLAFLSTRRCMGSKRIKERPWFLVGLAALSALASLLVLLNNRPDMDDITFFHRALAQLLRLDSPFSRGDTLHGVEGLPGISSLHIMTSYEPLVAMTAHLVGIDPLSAYQNLTAAIVAAMLPVVYVLLYRQFRLSRGTALLAALTAMVFLVLDGGPHRSLGNMAFVRLWQGKTILWNLMLPVTMLVASRFLFRPTPRRFAIVAMVSVSGVGLSNSGVYLTPVLVFAISAAYAAAHRFSPRRVRRAAILNLASFYPLAVGVLLQIGIIPKPADSTVFDTGWANNWFNNLQLVMSDTSTIIRNALMVLLLPLVFLPRGLRFIPVLMSLVLFAVFANPLTGPIWMREIHAASYWRLTYLFPVPWCVGLAACVWRGRRLELKRLGLRVSVCLIVLTASVMAYKSTVLGLGTSPPQVSFKRPWEYRFWRRELDFSRSVASRLKNRHVLAPVDLVMVLGLVEPTITFEATRSDYTFHVFACVGRKQEGQRRNAAQALVTRCEHTPDRDAALLESIRDGGVDAIVCRDHGDRVRSLIGFVEQKTGLKWVEAERGNGYVLFIRNAQ
jgi:hypothetical protein